MRTIRTAWAMIALGSGSAWAAPSCKDLCDDTIKACKQQCAEVLKKGAADKITHCQQKCEEFKKECERDCDNKKK